MAAAYDSRSLDVLVDEALDGEDYLVVERRFRILREAADTYVQLVEAREARRAVRGEHRDHAGRESAVGDDVDACGARFLVEREFGGDDRVVAAEVAEVRARFDGRARESEIVEVCDATDGRVVAAHQFDCARAVVNVELRGARAFAL